MLFTTLLAVVLSLTGCATVAKTPWDTTPPPSFHYDRNHAPSEPRVLQPVKVKAEGNTALRITLDPPRRRVLSGPVRFRVTELSGAISFKPNDRKFGLSQPRASFFVPFNVREGSAAMRFLVEWYHCPARGTSRCVQENGFYHIAMDAAKGAGLTYVPVRVLP